jgi:opacity protein-like surface antigen
MNGPNARAGGASSAREFRPLSSLRARLTRLSLLVLGAVVALPVTAAAQSGDGFLFQAPRLQLGLRAGVNIARANSQIFDFTTNQLTLDRSDFNAFSIAGDIGIRVIDAADVVLGFGYSSTSKLSEFRDYVDQDDLPIEQRTTFTQLPLTLSGRFYLTRRGREVGRFVWVPAQVAPYVGVGAGVVRYEFRQTGSFVDFQDLSVFDDTFESDGWTPVALVMAGLDYSLGPRVVLNGDVRYHFASADMNRDFTSFSDGIDLSGLQLSLGVHFRL